MVTLGKKGKREACGEAEAHDRSSGTDLAKIKARAFLYEDSVVSKLFTTLAERYKCAAVSRVILSSVFLVQISRRWIHSRDPNTAKVNRRPKVIFVDFH